MRRIIIPFFIFFITIIGFLTFTKTSYAGACVADDGRSWSACTPNPNNLNSLAGGACGPYSGSQSKLLTIGPNGGTKCTPTTKTRACQPTAAAACNSNICVDDKCVQCTASDAHQCSSAQHCANNTCVNNIPCTDGGAFGDCTANTPDALAGVGVCGKYSGHQSRMLTTGSKNCIPTPDKRFCQATPAQACNSNICLNDVCVTCTADNEHMCAATKHCENNTCVDNAIPATPTPTTPPAPVCDKNIPSLIVTSNNRNGDPGEEKVFDVKVTNNDVGKDCDPVTFVLSKEHLPNDNWTGQFDDSTLSIPKNDSKSTKFKVKSPASANGGPKTIIVGLRRQAQQEAQVKVNSTYTVSEPPPPTPTPTDTPAPPPPTQANRSPLVMGISMRYGRDRQLGVAKEIEEIENFKNQVGQYPGTYSIWNKINAPFPEQQLLSYLDSHSITPVIFMESDPHSDQEIANGVYDDFFRRWAQDARSYGKRTILRYDQEMNAGWFPWGHDAGTFVTSWKHIHDVIRSEGATNVEFFWCPWGGASWAVENMGNYYPGDNYVDYVGFDAYSGMDGAAHSSIQAAYSPAIAKVESLAPNKPIIIGETGISSNANGQADFGNYRNGWFKNGYEYVYNNWPKVKAILYLNYNQAELGEGSRDWKLDTNPNAISAYAEIAAKAKFQGRFGNTILASPRSATAKTTPTPGSGSNTSSNSNASASNTSQQQPNQTATPTFTPTPTPTPIPTPTPAPTFPPNSTVVSIAVGIDGIGTTAKVPIGGNTDPVDKTRDLEIKIYNAQDNSLAYSETQTFTYNPSIGKFETAIDIPSFPGTGAYNTYISGDSYTTTKFPQPITITANQQTKVASTNFNLATGNINNVDLSENNINLMDYQVLLSCSIYGKEKETCNRDPNYIKNSDLNSDGIVNEDDLTLWLIEKKNNSVAALP